MTASMRWSSHTLTVGLPQTNYRNFSEVACLMEAGHAFWQGLGDRLGRPVAQLRSGRGEPVYAAIYYVEERFPEHAGLETFRLDDRLRFFVGLRALKGMSIEARVMFDREDRWPASSSDGDAEPGRSGEHPEVRFGSIFASADPSSEGRLRPATPVNAQPSVLPTLPLEDHPGRITRAAQETGSLQLIPEAWRPLDPQTGPHFTYQVDPERDTNAAGLVYFANYVAFMTTAERWQAQQRGQSDEMRRRSLRHRRIAYYENAGWSDRLIVAVSRFGQEDHPESAGWRYRVTRERDGKLLCLSEALIAYAAEARERTGAPSEPSQVRA